jgi:putative oxidoreductase
LGALRAFLIDCPTTPTVTPTTSLPDSGVLAPFIGRQWVQLNLDGARTRQRTWREIVFSRSEDIALLFGRLFVAALFLPSAFNRSLALSSFAASLGAKGLPYATVIAAILVTAEVFATLALIIGAWPRLTTLALVLCTTVTLWVSLRHSLFGTIMRPSRNLEFYRTLAVMGGLLFYQASGPGAWSWKGGGGRGAKA